MKICPTCGTQNDANVRFCTSCGQEIPAGCPQCGAPVQPDQQFCAQCGYPSTATAPAPAPYAAPPNNAQPYTPNYGAPGAYASQAQQFPRNSKGQVAIGGWLLVYVIFLGIGVALALVNMFSGGAYLILGLIDLALFGWHLFAILARNRKQTFLSLYVLSGLTVLAAVVSMIIVISYGGVPDVASFIGTILGRVLWIIYFNKSQRVAATFPR